MLFFTLITSFFIHSSYASNCGSLWDSSATQTLKQNLNNTAEVIDLTGIFTTNPQHNAAVVNLLLHRTNLRFIVSISREVYQSSPLLFLLLKEHLHGRLFVEEVEITERLRRINSSDVATLNRLTFAHLRKNKIFTTNLRQGLDQLVTLWEKNEVYSN